jgi:hypothetical protein
MIPAAAPVQPHAMPRRRRRDANAWLVSGLSVVLGALVVVAARPAPHDGRALGAPAGAVAAPDGAPAARADALPAQPAPAARAGARATAAFLEAQPLADAVETPRATPWRMPLRSSGPESAPYAAAPSASASAFEANDFEASDFDASAAASAVAAAAATASGCGDGEHPGRRVTVLVTFAPSGRVTQALVAAGSLTGTLAGSCVANAMRAARVPPFAGDPVTVQKTLLIP